MIEIQKLEGMVDGLLGRYLAALFDFRVLAPMLYEQNVIEQHGKGSRAAGFISIRYGLYYHVLQECWKVGCDTDRNSASVARVMSALSEPKMRDLLRERYAKWTVPVAETVDERTKKLLEELDRADEDKRRGEFDDLWAELDRSWSDFKSARYYAGVATARNKVTAHTEIRCEDGKYRPLDLSDVGIKWGDERLFLDNLRKIIVNLDLIVRGSNFAWEEFDKQTIRDAKGYWRDD